MRGDDIRGDDGSVHYECYRAGAPSWNSIDYIIRETLTNFL